VACTTGSYNCNHDNSDGCEHVGPCETTSCDASVKDSCGSTLFFCNSSSQCEACPTVSAIPRYNCDGLGDCESSEPCWAASDCDPTCQAISEHLCVKDSTNICRECLNNDHCESNPRSLGRRCNLTTKLCECDERINIDDCLGWETGGVCWECEGPVAGSLCGVETADRTFCGCMVPIDCPDGTVCSAFSVCIKQ
jgi:hypothetical protein